MLRVVQDIFRIFEVVCWLASFARHIFAPIAILTPLLHIPVHVE
jgi:hypothetical protein